MRERGAGDRAEMRRERGHKGGARAAAPPQAHGQQRPPSPHPTILGLPNTGEANEPLPSCI